MIELEPENLQDTASTYEGTEFRSLYVWQEGKDLAVHIYHLTRGATFDEDPSLRDQLRRTAVLIPCSIAEGDERSPRETIVFLKEAKASLARLSTQLEIANDTHSIRDDVMNDLSNRCRRLERMLGGLIKSQAHSQRILEQ